MTGWDDLAVMVGGAARDAFGTTVLYRLERIDLNP